ARREFHGAECGRAARTGIAAEHPPGELQLAVVRAQGIQDAGGRGCRGAAQAHGAAGSADSMRLEGLLARTDSPAFGIELSGRASCPVVVVVPRARCKISGGVGKASPAGAAAQPLLLYRATF